MLLKKDRAITVGQEGSQERFGGYFERLYNVPPPAERLVGGNPLAVVVPDLPIKEDPPYCQKVKVCFLN